MITSAIVNHDYNNYYSFEEVGVTCLFGIVCLWISPHDGTTVLPLVAISCGTGITKYIISGCWSWILAKSDPETNFAPGKRLISLYKVGFSTSGGGFFILSSIFEILLSSRDISGLSFWAIDGCSISCSIHSGIGSALTVTISSFSSITRIFLSSGSSSSESHFGWLYQVTTFITCHSIGKADHHKEELRLNFSRKVIFRIALIARGSIWNSPKRKVGLSSREILLDGLFFLLNFK